MAVPLPVPPRPEDELFQPVQYLETSQLREQPDQSQRRYLVSSENLLPFELPPIPGTPGAAPPPDVDEEFVPMHQVLPDVIAGRMSPDQQAIMEAYWRSFYVPPTTVAGKRGKEDADEGLEYYSRIPGDLVIEQNKFWIHNPETGEYKPFTIEHAFNERTGQVYEAVPEDPNAVPLAGTVAEVPARARTVARSLVMGPITALGRAQERVRLGLTAPNSTIAQEAMQVAGAVTAGGTVPRVTQEIAAQARRRPPTPAAAAVPEGEVSRPLATPEPEPAFTPRYRYRGIEEPLPRTHITYENLVRRRQERAIAAARPETDEAGFYVNALERGKTELPEQATAGEMRAALNEIGVDDAEIALLDLDRFLLGEAGVARGEAREAGQELGRLGSAYGRALKNAKADPTDPVAQKKARDALQALVDAKPRVAAAESAAINAQRAHIQSTLDAHRSAEVYLKRINQEIRNVRKEGQTGNDLRSVEFPGVNLLEERMRQRDVIRQALQRMEEARSNDPSLQTVTRQQVLDHIRENRPRLAIEERSYPQQQFGDMTEPIRRITTIPPGSGSALEIVLLQRGVNSKTAHDIASSFANASPTDWGVMARGLSEHMGQHDLIAKAVEDAAGAPIVRMAQAWRASRQSASNPRYPQAIPDRNNPTMRELAVVLEGPWSVRRQIRTEINAAKANRDALFKIYESQAKDTPEEAQALASFHSAERDVIELAQRLENAPKPPFTISHWTGGVSPIGHMQTTIQLAPVEHSPRVQRLIQGVRAKITTLEEEKAGLNRRMEALGDATDEWHALNQQTYRIDDQIKVLEQRLPQTAASEDRIFMGNQFQSDWAIQGADEGFMSRDAWARVRGIDEQITETTAQIARLTEEIDRINSRQNRGGMGQMAHLSDMESRRAYGDVRNRVEAIREEIRYLQEHRNELRQEHSALNERPVFHGLVANTRAWLRPMLEKFVDEGIASGSRYLGVPSGATVSRWNQISPGTMRFYDETVMRELQHVMERRGLPYKTRQISTMHSPVESTSFTGQWTLIEIPANARSGRGVRLMTTGGVPQVEENE